MIELGDVGGRTRLATVLVAAIVLTAGCSGVLDNGEESDVDALELIPSGVDGVAAVDSGIATDQTTVDVVDGLLELADEEDPEYEGPTSYEEAVQELESESELGVGGFNGGWMFFQVQEDISVEENEYVGFIANTDYTFEELVSADNETSLEDFEEETYEGVTLHVNESEFGQTTYIADLGDGWFAIGPEQPVKDVVDTREGIDGAEAFGGELRDTFESVEDGYVTAAVTVPQDQFEDSQTPTPEIVTMSYFVEGGDMTVEAQLTMNSADDAEELSGTINFFTGFLIDNAEQQGNEQVVEQLEKIEVDSDEELVTVSFVTTPEEIVAAAEESSDQVGPDVNSIDRTAPAVEG